MSDAYLLAKRSVDDRALNRRVWRSFVEELDAIDRRTDGPVRVSEIGGGVGTMVARLAARDVLPPAVDYRLIDRSEGCVETARERLPGWLAAVGYDVEHTSDGLVARLEESEPTRRLEVTLESGDALLQDVGADVVIAAAVVDLLDRERLVRWLESVLRPNGSFYAPITYDGATGFAPSHALDDRIERFYHRHMDEVRDAPGSSRAGRQLVAELAGRGFDRVETGGSDWVIHPGGGGSTADEPYSSDDATVLHAVLDDIEAALSEYPTDALDPDDRRRWLETRRTQFDRGELTYVAHNLDVLARR
ncbi:SAM-dependent methyltransferase [Halovivax gelatinilyticus]|uniref:SAM-dependent methyltransferase n=1 Tax=Halovivax gelatinilyticus TaxID=2961597 RepID=UPI0020CA36F0|nr:SAM-dependent methyltransferase [Halovivax gelatinilyticus]